jgi:outer membrane scaffolding protein for murein synthesis (MipA/OmpV family)
VSKPTVWEGAFGLTTSYRPEYSGAARQIFKVSPALFLRYGRFTITNASGFVTRRADDVMRGLGMDMVRSDAVRVNLALRVDQGRGEDTSEALRGMGNIRATIRTRMAASWRLQGPWRTGASWSVDIAGRGGGQFGDIGGGWEQRIAPDTVLNIGGGLSFGNGRYMQNFFGVTAEQAARTGYPVYVPGAGLRDASAAINLRHDFGTEWTALAGASTTRLLGAAAASPLTGRKGTWGLSAGLARRF